MMVDLIKYANEIPQLAHGGRSNQHDLIAYARDVQSGDYIIDLGSYLGSSVLFEAEGIRQSGNDVKIYAYDRWKLDDGMNHKAKKHLGKLYKDGKDFKFAFDKNIEPVKDRVVSIQTHVLKIKWNLGNVGLYVDDIGVGKLRVDHLMKTFSPYFIKDKTILMILDYYNYMKNNKSKHSLYQPDFFTANKKVFQFIKKVNGSIAAVLLYKGGKIDYNVEGSSYAKDS